MRHRAVFLEVLRDRRKLDDFDPLLAESGTDDSVLVEIPDQVLHFENTPLTRAIRGVRDADQCVAGRENAGADFGGNAEINRDERRQ